MDELKPGHNRANMMGSISPGVPRASQQPQHSPCPQSGSSTLVSTCPKTWKGFSPKTYKICSLSACRKITKCYFAAFFPYPLRTQTRLCSSLSVRLPEPGTYPRVREEGPCAARCRGKVSALRKRCSKSTAVRERCPQKRTAQERTVSVSFVKLTPKWQKMRERWANYKAKTGMQMSSRNSSPEFSHRFSLHPQKSLRKGLPFSFPLIISYIGSSRGVSITHSPYGLPERSTDPMEAKTPLLKLLFHHHHVENQKWTCMATFTLLTPLPRISPRPKPHVPRGTRHAGRQQRATRSGKLLSHGKNPLRHVPVEELKALSFCFNGVIYHPIPFKSN